MKFLKTAVIVFLSSLFGATAMAGAEEDAKAAFTEGQKSFDAGRYKEASKQFQQAYDLKPAWKLLYNIAQAQAAAKQYGIALQTFEKYIAQGGDDIPVDRIDEVRKEIDRLRDMVGAVDVKAPDGCQVFLNDEDMGTTPLPGPMRITAGISFTLKVQKGDSVLLTRPVTVGSREQIVVEVTDGDDESADPTPATVAPAKPAEKKKPGPLVVAGWITAGVGAAALIGGGVAGGLALKWNNELRDSAACDGNDCGPAEHETIDKRDNAALASTILLSAGGAIAVAGVVMILVGSKKGKERVSVYPVLQTEMLGAVVQGRF